jgi:hypothetical protein
MLARVRNAFAHEYRARCCVSGNLLWISGFLQAVVSTGRTLRSARLRACHVRVRLDFLFGEIFFFTTRCPA